MGGCLPHDSDWQDCLVEAVRSPAELCGLLGLPAARVGEMELAAADFPMLVPRAWLGRVRRGDLADPLLRQVLPTVEECRPVDGFTADPLAESRAACSAGLLKKYQGRALVVATPTCAVHCRYCFRRHFPFDRLECESGRLAAALAAIDADASIAEVILSGGDPLMLADDRLAGLAQALERIEHVRRLRIHTRMPIVIPQRVTPSLVGVLRATRRAVIVVVQVNHPAEIDQHVAAALERLVDAGIPVLNQSVLLRGVNDRAEVLESLCRRLVDLRVLPYYLHQLDRVAGAAHFEVPEQEGRALVKALRARLPGYAVPRYVRETPGQTAKEPLA